MDFRFLSFVLALSLATPCVDGRAHGGEVQWSAPPTAYEGEPFTLQLKFENCETHERPQLSDNDVFTFRPFGGPSRQAMTRIINGRRFSRESVTYQYQVTANQHGKLKLGPITVKHDGVSELLDPITIDVSPSDREKMLYATITSDTEEAFVGQSVIATLRVWVTIPEDLIASSVETEYRI
ncbi:MAG: BatD family protein, partial [Planctomycetota bacterium]